MEKADEAPSCANCKKTRPDAPNLKFCAKCQTTCYCSRECQKADWKVHKKVCAKNAQKLSEDSSSNYDSGRSPPFSNPSVIHSSDYQTPHLKNMEMQVDKPFTRLDKGTYLHGRPEKDVYKLLVDSFRMRQEDNYKLEGDVDVNSIYDGSPSSSPGFQEFLELAHSRHNLLPPWWNKTKYDECKKFGQSDNWCDLRRAVEKQDIMEHYGDQKMPMQLRMLAEVVYGRGPMGHNGKEMRKTMVKMEEGGGESKESVSMLFFG